ncbi:hypothetical protein QLS31_06180 [Flavobacterium sp. XS2P24]|uniref:hypothetical protein n=1 Tax=Flavobacterium sp. XS2P24 TaxID=3041249 RepID=UPI0024A978A4|nr:hypothetical protein [Flavobacterium sp. XS2P24]MDI6049410.1 hypothetical protein [Flavobacterium sp. XS2P24]
MDIIQISKDILTRLTKMDYERNGGSSSERLIFPNKFPSEAKNKVITEKELLKYTRISEQELRFLFVEQFIKVTGKEFFYSVETPTEKKYRFGKTNEDIKPDITGRSASIDMCVFKRDSDNKYNRFLNIEFKNENASKKSISKDILKLMYEKENGAFILLLKNTDEGTLKSIFDKFSSSFDAHLLKDNWTDNPTTFIEIIILSLEEKRNKNGTPFLINRKIKKGDNLMDIFLFDGSLADINEVKRNGWEIEPIEKVTMCNVEEELGMVAEEKVRYGK